MDYSAPIITDKELHRGDHTKKQMLFLVIAIALVLIGFVTPKAIIAAAALIAVLVIGFLIGALV